MKRPRATPPPETPGVTLGPIQYARSSGVNIAYQVCGNGPLDLVFVMGWVSHLEYFWKEPSFARFLTRLASGDVQGLDGSTAGLMQRLR